MKLPFLPLAVIVIATALTTRSFGQQPADLPPGEIAGLVSQAKELVEAMRKGDADAIIRLTHPGIVKLFGSKEKFEASTRKGVSAFRGLNLNQQEEWGKPSPLYRIGDQDICFLPKTAIMIQGDKKARRESFLIAGRKVGTSTWQFLDAAGFRDKPQTLWRLFPTLPKDAAVPPNTITPVE